MSDHQDEMEPTGWKGEWITRTYVPLKCYLGIIVCVVASLVLGFGFACWFITRRYTKALKANPSDRAIIHNKMHKKMLKCTKVLFACAVVYMANIFMTVMVDAYIGAFAVKDGVQSELANGKDRLELALEIGMIILWVSALFIATLVVVPLLQMLLVTYILSRFRNKHGSNALVDYIPEARYMSTHIALIWTTIGFWISAWWAPASDSYMWRYIFLQACVGSASAWLDASFAFNFCHDQLEDIKLGGSRLRDVLRMFSNTAKAAHTRKAVDEKLPLYKDNAREDFTNDEKQ